MVLKSARATLASSSTIMPDGPIAWHTVGSAFDYRARYCFAVPEMRTLVAYKGASACILGANPSPTAGASGTIRIEPRIVREVFYDIARIVTETHPRGRRIPDPQERQLARACYVLALFGDVFRAGLGIRSPLFAERWRRGCDLLEIPTDSVIDDLCALAVAFLDYFRDDLHTFA